MCKEFGEISAKSVTLKSSNYIRFTCSNKYLLFDILRTNCAEEVNNCRNKFAWKIYK